MKTFFIDTTIKPIPELRAVEDLALNALISPSGDFYGMPGGAHELASRYVAIMLLDVHPDDLYKGAFFKDSFEDHLRKLGFLVIKDISWITDTEPDLKRKKPEAFEPSNVTQSQLDRVFDYDEAHGSDLIKTLS